ncbi:carbohydrate ABC transporter permease [Paraburkholderia susongensis]|uniref:Carbohydrate ABC transporter membrane protein 1, CUT1 family n=1 Tax=Paraburkholderia susongensis TaxID=1515439 RepID=A0A1X7KWM4_9BURK|nr:sugar ABC transporter permease [Paraburkholderia susongensis]SMG45745.1 carbohydrate ABC transporter membrane protein 1, CUT1 family [Paraburkholderia susongensis]
MTASISGNGKTASAARRASPMAALADRWIPKLVLAPSVVISLIFVYGFIAITGYLSLSNSRLMPRFEFAGLERYRELFANDVFWTSAANLGWFGIPFIGVCIGLGLLLAILLDQQIRNEGALRAVFLYPMALSFIVTGTAWQWILTPSIGLEKVFHDWGWTSFSFNWLGDPDRAIFCVVIAAVWQSTGFVMALFLAGLRGVDGEIFKAAQMDGANLPTIYRKIVIPSMRPVFFSVLLILCHITIKTFDLVVALTAGGPGTSSSLPAIFMYTFSFNRGQLGVGAASSMMMLATVVAVLVPLMYMESRSTRNAA